jgi:hypothetical protein
MSLFMPLSVLLSLSLSLSQSLPMFMSMSKSMSIFMIRIMKMNRTGQDMGRVADRDTDQEKFILMGLIPHRNLLREV